jgi:hypothetical protein
MPKRKKKATRSARQSDSREQYLAETEITSCIKQLSEAETEKQREKIRARMKRLIGQQN